MNKMSKLMIAVFATIGLPLLSYAQDRDRHRCTMGDLTRRVEIIHETGVSVPCEVHYYKDSEMPGERQVLWRAANEEGYCEARTSEFVARLTDMGWNCGIAEVAVESSSDATADSAMTEDAMPADTAIDDMANDMADDTEALAPADDGEPPRR